jgi:hypothetical protein
MMIQKVHILRPEENKAMTIVCKMDKDGGFYAADCDTQQIEYAYPSSIHAEQAKKNPINAAREMLSVPAIHYAGRWEYMRNKMLAVETHPSMPVCATWDASDEQTA